MVRVTIRCLGRTEDTKNDKAERLPTPAGEQRLTLLNTFFKTPKHDVSYHFQSSNASKVRYHLDYVLTQQKDRRLVRNVSVSGPPLL